MQVLFSEIFSLNEVPRRRFYFAEIDGIAELKIVDPVRLKSGRHLSTEAGLGCTFFTLEVCAASRILSPSLGASDCHPGSELRHRRPVAHAAGGPCTPERSMLYLCKLALIRAGGAAGSRSTIFCA